MASGFRWFPLWTLVVVLGPPTAEADPASPPHYVLHQTELNFDKATQACAPGTLTTLATHQELAEVLRQVSEAQQSRFTFWVGLKKAKNECVVSTLPLRGFKWTTDGGEDTEVSRWWVEPEHTCTSNRCAALTGTFDGSTVKKWGLISLSCRIQHQYICKLGDGQEPGPAAPKPATPEPEPGLPTQKLEPPPGPGPVLTVSPTPEARPEPATPKPDPGRPSTKQEPEPEPTTPAPKPALPPPKPTERQVAAPEPNLKPTPGPATPKPAAAGPPEPGPSQPGPDQPPGPGLDSAPGPGPDQPPGPGPDPAPGPSSHRCSTPFVTDIRSFSPDQNNNSSTLMECWSKVKLRLFCGGRPTVWRLVDHSPVNFTTICLPCDPGFSKNASGHCVDVDECAAGGGGGGSGPCKHECVNTEGSYSCICTDQDGRQHEEGSDECVAAQGSGSGGAMSGIWIPVLAAVASLVVLLVVVAVMVKCCLMRRERRRELREEEERMAMKNKEGS